MSRQQSPSRVMKYLLATLALSHPASKYLHTSEASVLVHSRSDPCSALQKSDDSFAEQHRAAEGGRCKGEIPRSGLSVLCLLYEDLWTRRAVFFFSCFCVHAWGFLKSSTPVIQLPERPYNLLGGRSNQRAKEALGVPRSLLFKYPETSQARIVIIPPKSEIATQALHGKLLLAGTSQKQARSKQDSYSYLSTCECQWLMPYPWPTSPWCRQSERWTRDMVNGFITWKTLDLWS